MLAVLALFPAPGSSALVIGAAFVLLGNAMMMVTRWPIYSVENRKAWLKKWGLRISFGGAVFAVWGAAKPMWSGKYPVVSAVLLVVALAMSGLLLAPIVLRVPPSVKEKETEEHPSDERQSTNGAAVTVRASADPEIDVEDATEGEADLGEPPEVHPKASES